MADEFRDTAVFGAAAAALYALKLALCKRFLRDNDAQRNADKVAVGKLFPRARVAVVLQRLNTGQGKLTVQLLRFFLHFGVIAKLYQMHGKRRDSLRPHETLAVG